MKKPFSEKIVLEKIVGGGQTLGTLSDGRKAFVWGGLPNESVEVSFHKQKKNYVEGVVSEVVTQSPHRVTPKDPDSYLSTSPWQIMDFVQEQHYKSALIEEAFELHDIVLPSSIETYTDGVEYGYRNKVEFSWWWDNDTNQLDLAFFRRGSQGKVPVDGTSLAPESINILARKIRYILRTKDIEARALKTLLIRADQQGNCVFQLYVKEKDFQPLTDGDFASTGAQGGEVIYSDHRSPASVITKRLVSFGDVTLTDTVLGIPFRYATEGFFQGNIPVYEEALRDMELWIDRSAPASGDKRRGNSQNSLPEAKVLGVDRLAGPEESERTNEQDAAREANVHPVVDMYSGVGSIGFTIGGDHLTMVEINKAAVDEMKKNRYELGKKATIIEASAEGSLEYITGDATIILDPPRAGLHEAVVDRLLEVKPARIIYLSCNPVTQARDIKYLAESYGIRYHRGYNFFPRTPHIEHLVVLDLK